MQATNSQLIDFIGASKQYFIPIFQREYSWDVNDCSKLLFFIKTNNQTKTR